MPFKIVIGHRLISTIHAKLLLHIFRNFKSFFSRCLPSDKSKKRYRNRLPWLTEGLKGTIKHKNKLYKISMKYEISFNKNCYTQYKNKLTTILSRQEKEYYKLLLETNRNNLKKMWSVIRNVINNCKPSKLNESFLYDKSVITEKKMFQTNSTTIL